MEIESKPDSKELTLEEYLEQYKGHAKYIRMLNLIERHPKQRVEVL